MNELFGGVDPLTVAAETARSRAERALDLLQDAPEDQSLVVLAHQAVATALLALVAEMRAAR